MVCPQPQQLLAAAAAARGCPVRLLGTVRDSKRRPLGLWTGTENSAISTLFYALADGK